MLRAEQLPPAGRGGGRIGRYAIVSVSVIIVCGVSTAVGIPDAVEGLQVRPWDWDFTVVGIHDFQRSIEAGPETSGRLPPYGAGPKGGQPSSRG